MDIRKFCSRDDTRISSTSTTKYAASLYSCTQIDACHHITVLAENDAAASKQYIAQSKAYLAGIAYKNWKADRNVKKVGKAGAGLQNFLCTIGDFLAGFSGIGKIIKDTDQRFGELACGTVVLLATVAVIKSRREESIENDLAELALAFPRLNTLQELHQSAQLKKLIVAVFELAIKFCRECISYFAKSNRVMKAIVPSEWKMDTLMRLRNMLLEVRKECDIVLLLRLAGLRSRLQNIELELEEANIRLKEIRETSKGIETTGIDTNFRVTETEARLKQDVESRAKKVYLSKLKSELQIKNVDELTVTEAASEVKKLLRTAFSGRRQNFLRSPQRLSPALLEESKEFVRWRNKSGQSMFILAGNNLVDDASVQVNWLSYASAWAAESMRQISHVLAFLARRTIQ